MGFLEDDIREILIKKPSECAYLDYKVYPYTSKSKHDFVRDVIAMLNSEEAVGKDKYIILGIEDKTKFLKGLELEDCQDDNIYQGWVDNIEPRPQIQSGTIEFEGKIFGYIYISKDNINRVYEVGTTVISDKNSKPSEKAGAYKGQAYIRQGSRNSILMQQQRMRISQQKVQTEKAVHEIFSHDYLGIEDNYYKALSIAVILGQWSEEYDGDKEIIEKLFGRSYKTFITIIRNLHMKYEQHISINNGIWKILNRKNFLEYVAKNIYDEDIDILFNCIKIMYTKTSPKYDLVSEQRFAYSIYRDKKQEMYSNNILHGVAVFLAIAGNNLELFTACSKYKVEICIHNIISEVFSFVDWKNYATLQEIFDYLAEAAPESFLSSMEKAIIDNNIGLIEYLQEKETSIAEINYGDHFRWTLTKLAAYPDYFAKACYILFLLAKNREVYLDSLVGVILPWFPQTLAKASVRIGMVKGLLRVDEDLGWKFLMKLMPNRTTTGNPVQKSKYMKQIDIPEKISSSEFWSDEENYIKLACGLAEKNEKRLIELLEVIDDVPKNIFDEIILTFEKNVNAVKNKFIIWNSIIDLLTKHKKYYDSSWALCKESICTLEELAKKYAPKSKIEQSKRLFQNEQYSLLEEKGSWTDNSEKLFLEQKEVVKKIYDEGGLRGILVYNESINRHDILGRAFSFCKLSDFETREVLLRIVSENTALYEFAKGFVSSIYNNYPDIFIKQVDLLDDENIKAKIYSEVHLTKMSIEAVSHFNRESQEIFWKNINIFGIDELQDNYFESVVINLNECKRIGDSINLLFYQIKYEKKKINIDLLIETLFLYVQNQQINVDIYSLQGIIQWLENNCDNEQIVTDIEWKYLNIFDEDNIPRLLQKELSTKPEFFMDILCGAFKGRNDERRELSKEEEIIANHCHKLLFGWKRIPGLNDDNSFDENKLVMWYDTVKQLSKQKDRYEVAMTYFGHTLFHSPKDKDGFFINKKVAEIIQEDMDGYIRDGYSSEAYNSRGVHWLDPSGEEEFAIEKKYIEKAEAADTNGYFKLGELLREIAKSFHRDGLHNIEEHKQWEKSSDENDE